jgi:hypothetical protein
MQIGLQRRSEADLDPGSDLPVRGLALDHGGGPVALRLEFLPYAPADDGELAIGRQHRASRHPEAVAERAARRQAQHLGRRQRTADAEQASDLVRGESGAFVLDEIAAVILAYRDLCASVERVVGKLLQDQSDEPVQRHPGLLLQPVEGAEAGPIGALKFKILSVG